MTTATHNWTRSMNCSKCAWCDDIINRGEIKCSFADQTQFNKKMRELISPKICEMGLPTGVRLLIGQFYGVKNTVPQDYCEDCANFDVKLTRRGRVIRKPIRLENETFVTGSGVSGCDQYDRRYDNGALNSFDRHWRDYPHSANLSGFVVDDDVEVEVENDASEESSEECDDWSETDEEEESSDVEWD